MSVILLENPAGNMRFRGEEMGHLPSNAHQSLDEGGSLRLIPQTFPPALFMGRESSGGQKELQRVTGPGRCKLGSKPG